jgi:hypothetical protein
MRTPSQMPESRQSESIIATSKVDATAVSLSLDVDSAGAGVEITKMTSVIAKIRVSISDTVLAR